jgi:hypothetical protein
LAIVQAASACFKSRRISFTGTSGSFRPSAAHVARMVAQTICSSEADDDDFELDAFRDVSDLVAPRRSGRLDCWCRRLSMLSIRNVSLLLLFVGPVREATLRVEEEAEEEELDGPSLLLLPLECVVEQPFCCC